MKMRLLLGVALGAALACVLSIATPVALAGTELGVAVEKSQPADYAVMVSSADVARAPLGTWSKPDPLTVSAAAPTCVNRDVLYAIHRRASVAPPRVMGTVCAGFSRPPMRLIT